MGLFQSNNAEIVEEHAAKESVFPMMHAENSSHKNNSDTHSHEAASYSVGDLIKLFHSLPQQNPDAEISAVLRTISSFDINLKDLMEDLANQESLAKKRLKVLELEIELFEAKIKNRKREMNLLQVGIAEMVKSKTYINKGMRRINEENITVTQKKQKKRAVKLKNIPELNNPIPIAEKIKIVTSKEIDEINSTDNVKSITSRLRSRFFRFKVVSLIALLMISF